MKQENLPNDNAIKAKILPARANIVLFLFLTYWLFIPHAVYALIDVEPMSLFAYSATISTVRFLPPILIYLLFAKKPPRAVFSLAPLSLTTVLYIVVITAAVRIIEFLLEFGLPLAFGFAPPPWTQMGPAWVHLMAVVLLGSVYREFMIRGVLYSEYRDQGVSIGKTALVTGLFFGLTHVGLVGIAASAMLGIFWAYLLYYTRSIWAPLISHAIYNALWQMHPAFRIGNQAEYEAWLPTFVLILGIAALFAAPAMVVCAKKFWAENRREPEARMEESKAFTWSYWALIGVMTAAIVVFRV